MASRSRTKYIEIAPSNPSYSTGLKTPVWHVWPAFQNQKVITIITLFGKQRHATGNLTMADRRTIREQIDLLAQYSACDISDALVKLQKPTPGQAARAGYLADIVPYAPSSPLAPMDQPEVIAPASTLKLVDKSEKLDPPVNEQLHGFPQGGHWADLTDADTMLVIEQPLHQTCAAVGGIMASRMKIRGLLGCVVSGRVRDLGELRKSGLPIWATSRSTVGSGAESKVHSRNITISVNDISISPGDIVFADSIDGIVVIPINLVDDVIDLIPQLVQADERVKHDVEAGSTVSAAFKKHRN